MGCNPTYDILFQEMKIGPVTAPNRFYQTPHATGMGWRAPKASAALRGVKAEGGWALSPPNIVPFIRRLMIFPMVT